MDSSPSAARFTATRTGTALRLLLLLLALVSPWTVNDCHAQQPPLLERLTQALNEVLNGLQAGPDAEVMQAVQIGVAVDPAENAGMKQVQQATQQRNLRLLNAAASWMNSVAALTPEQRMQVAQQIQQQLTAAPDLQQRRRINRGEAAQSMAPILYGGPQGAGRSLANALVENVLQNVADEQQKQKLQAALQERANFQRTTFAAYIADLVDRRLFLTIQQAEKLTGIVDQHLQVAGEKSWHPLYSATPYSYFLPYENLWTCVTEQARKDVLNETQAQFLAETAKLGDSLDQMHLSSSQTPEEWLKFVEEASQKLEPWMLSAYRTRSQWYTESFQLSAEQTAALRLAALGATSSGLRGWRDQCYNTIDQIENHRQQFAGGGNFSFGLTRPDVYSQHENPSAIWQNAIDQLSLGQQAQTLKEQRKERRRQADSHCVTALLDQELWLLPEQRDAIRKITLETLPKQEPFDHYDYFRDIILFCCPVLLADLDVVRQSLSAEQFEVWQGTAQLFRYNKDNRLVELNLQDQGQWTFQLNQ